MTKEYVLVHGLPRECPKAHVAIEINEGLAQKIKRDPICLACGKPALKAIKRASKGYRS